MRLGDHCVGTGLASHIVSTRLLKAVYGFNSSAYLVRSRRDSQRGYFRINISLKVSIYEDIVYTKFMHLNSNVFES